MIEEVLNNAGLSTEETEIYLSLLEKGSQSASELAITTTVKRTYVYAICEELLKKGVISSERTGTKTIFTPLAPDRLLTLAVKNKERAEQAEKSLEGILLNLQKKYALVEERPVIRSYEGFEGLKKIYEDTIAEKQPISAFLQNTDISPKFRQWLREYYLKARVSNEINANVILASGEKAEMYASEDVNNLRKTKIIPSAKFPFAVEVNIYGSKVAFINYKNTDSPIGVVIDNTDIAQTLKAFFDLTWGTLPSSGT